MFKIIPAIDLKGGRCVRLRQGRARDVKVYSEDPVEMARHWVALGAEYLHVVDLDGAFQGHPVNSRIIMDIVRAVSVPVQAGGGLRTDADLEAMMDGGVKRAIVGTRAFAKPFELKRLVRRFGANLAVGIDARSGMVQVKGWVETTGMKAVDLAAAVDVMGVRTLIYTDTERDGMMGGINIDSIGEICRNVSCDVIASGGITSVRDVTSLVDLRRGNLIGAIVGKALYEEKVTLAALNKARYAPAPARRRRAAGDRKAARKDRPC